MEIVTGNGQSQSSSAANLSQALDDWNSMDWKENFSQTEQKI
jgi:hypothetical protein